MASDQLWMDVCMYENWQGRAGAVQEGSLMKEEPRRAAKKGITMFVAVLLFIIHLLHFSF